MKIRLDIIFYIFLIVSLLTSCNRQNKKKELVNSITIENQIPKEYKIETIEKINFDGDSDIETIITAYDSANEMTKEFWFKNNSLAYSFYYPSGSINKKWLVDLDNDKEKEIIRAQGYEDGVDYAIFDIQNGNQIPLFYFNPTLIDNKYPDILFWGYPWDIKNLIVNNKNEILVSTNNEFNREDEYSMADGQKQLPYVFFNGTTTQPEFRVKDIDSPKYLSINKLIEETKIPYQIKE